MKKMLFVTTLIMLILLCCGVFAADTELKWRIDGVSDAGVTITPDTNTQSGTEYTLIAAEYEDDVLIGVQFKSGKIENTNSFNIPLDRKPSYGSKIMLWNNAADCEPLAEPYIIGLSPTPMPTFEVAYGLAFPGAEGAGKFAKGAREFPNISVYHVTNLEDEGPGSFRDAVSKPGRIVVFDVGGTINLMTTIRNVYGVTILGQTAPGDGITITGANIVMSGDSIVRYIRVRPTDFRRLEIDGFGGASDNTIIDHCSVSYSVDECLTFYGGANMTVQNCISSESLKQSVHIKGNHGYGGIWGGTNTSYHHNLMASHDSRTPRLDRQLQETDVRNNIIYQWGNTNSAYGGESTAYDGTYYGSDTKVNWVNNYYKPGPGTKSNLRTRIFDTSSPKEHPSYFYFAGNVMEGSDEVTNDNTKGVRINSDKGMVFLTEPVPMVNEIPYESAYDTYNTLLDHVGASLPKRDETDARVINDVKCGTGRIIDSAEEVGGVMQYEPVYRTFEIPQDWKEENGMDGAKETDIVPTGKWKGYTWIEAYVNDWTMRQEYPTNPDVSLEVTGTGRMLNFNISAAPKPGTKITKLVLYNRDEKMMEFESSSINQTIEVPINVYYFSVVAYNDKGEATRSTPVEVIN